MPSHPSGGPRTIIDRPTYNEDQFHSGFRPAPTPTPKTLIQRLKCARPSRASLTRFLLAHFPIVTTLMNYKISWKDKIIGDLAGGLTTGIMTIPQGLAYASLANVNSVYGLYTGIFPVIIYVLLGTSQHLSMGVFAVVTIMIGDAVLAQLHGAKSIIANETAANTCNGTILTVTNLTNNGAILNGTISDEIPLQKEDIAIALTLVVGVVQILFYVFRLGFVTRFMSDAMVSGFTTGAAFHVAASQIRHVFGLELSYRSPFVVPKTIYGVFKNIADTNAAAFIIAVISIVFLVIVKYVNQRYQKKLRFPIPGELIIVIIGTGVSYGGKFEENFDVKVVADLRSGVPTPRAPRFDVIVDLLSTSYPYVIAVVSFAVNMSIAKLFAKKFRYQMNSNQELLAYGTSNIFGSFFNCLVASGSLSRSAVYASCGGRTIVGSSFSALLILIVVLAIAQLFAALPKAVLAAVIFVGLRGLFVQFRDVKRLYRLSLSDMFVWIVTWLATAVVSVDIGLAVGIGFSLLVIIYRTAWPHHTLLGRMSDTDLYREVSRYYMCEEVDGIKIFRYEASLCFANAESFKAALLKSLGSINLDDPDSALGESVQTTRSNAVNDDDDDSPPEYRRNLSARELAPQRKSPIHTVVVDCTVVTYLDSLGVGLLIELTKDLEEAGLQMLLAGCRWRVRQSLKQGLYLDKVGSDHLFVTIHDAVVFAQTGLRLMRKSGSGEVSCQPADEAGEGSGDKSSSISSTHSNILSETSV